MNEKRFTVDDDGIYDNQEKKHFKFIAYDWIDCDIYECCEKLNEQQATIEMYQRRVDSLKKTDFDFTIKQGELITKFSLGEDKILFETTQDYETIQTLSKWLYSMYDEIQKLKKELKWKREEIKALIEESERDE